MDAGKLSDKIIGNSPFLLFLVATNIAGFFAGIYHYWAQMSDSTPLLWIVIIDSPLSVLLFAALCALILLGRKPPETLKYLSAVYLIKYGSWTMIVIALYWQNYVAGGTELLGAVNFLLHFGMILEGLVLIPGIVTGKKSLAAVLGLVLLNDFFDYFLGTVTRIPQDHIGYLAIESFSATVILTILIAFLNKQS